MSDSPHDHNSPDFPNDTQSSIPPPFATAFDVSVAEIPLARPISVLSTLRADDPRFLLKLPTLSRRAAWFDIALFIVAMIALEIVSTWLIFHFFGIEIPEGETMPADMKRRLILPTVTTRAFTSLLLISVILGRRNQSLAAIGLSLRRPFLNALIGLVGVGAMAAVIFYVMILLILLFPALRSEMEKNAKGILEWLPHLQPAGFAALMMCVGFYEEVIFRGFLMPRLRRGFNHWPLAVLVSSILFTLPHLADQTLGTQIPLFLLSLGLSILTIWRASLIPAIVAHAVWNLVTVLILHFSMGDQWK